MIVLIPYINLLNLSWTIKCLFLNNMEPLKRGEKMDAELDSERAEELIGQFSDQGSGYRATGAK